MDPNNLGGLIILVIGLTSYSLRKVWARKTLEFHQKFATIRNYELMASIVSIILIIFGISMILFG